MILTGFFCAILITALAIALGGPEKLLIFWDAPSVMVVVMTNAILVLSSGKGKVFLRGLAETTTLGPPQPKENGEEVAGLFPLSLHRQCLRWLFLESDRLRTHAGRS